MTSKISKRFEYRIKMYYSLIVHVLSTALGLSVCCDIKPAPNKCYHSVRNEFNQLIIIFVSVQHRSKLWIQTNFQIVTPPQEVHHACSPNPCGSNAICKERNGAGACQCLPDYYGDPYSGCRPECVQNDDCRNDRACLNNKCVDPCPGVCAQNAECRVHNHAPQCSCIVGYVGNPLVGCHKEEIIPPSKNHHLSDWTIF